MDWQNPRSYSNEMSKSVNRKTNYKIFPYVNVTTASEIQSTVAGNFAPLRKIEEFCFLKKKKYFNKWKHIKQPKSTTNFLCDIMQVS